MGRRRKQVVKVMRRTLPGLFLCPKCGKNGLKAAVDETGTSAAVVCGICDLKSEFQISRKMDPVDVYCLFIDKHYKGS